MIKKLFTLIFLAIIGFCIVAALQPSSFRISRSATISAPAATLFEHVNNLHQWDAWSPWAKLDPNAKNSFEGPEAGVGAIMRWAGNYEVGEGSMTILQSTPASHIQFRLDFIKPFSGTNLADFNFTEENGKTKVEWVMTGENSFVGKAMSLIMNCDKMVGGQFEKGLENLRAVTERK